MRNFLLEAAVLSFGNIKTDFQIISNVLINISFLEIRLQGYDFENRSGHSGTCKMTVRAAFVVRMSTEATLLFLSTHFQT